MLYFTHTLNSFYRCHHLHSNRLKQPILNSIPIPQKTGPAAFPQEISTRNGMLMTSKCTSLYLDRHPSGSKSVGPQVIHTFASQASLLLPKTK